MKSQHKKKIRVLLGWKKRKEEERGVDMEQATPTVVPGTDI